MGQDTEQLPEKNENLGTGKKSDGYKRVMRRWVAFLIHEPDALLAGSAPFLLIALPVITIGPAWIALHYYTRAREAGVKRTWRDACRFAFKRCGAKAWLMGATDALALIMAGGCLLGVFGLAGVFGAFALPTTAAAAADNAIVTAAADTAIATAAPATSITAAAIETAYMLPLPFRLLYALLFAADILYIMSGIYRYPALCAEPDTGFAQLVSRGFLLALGNPGWTLMFLFASLLTLLICALTGVGILLLFPAAASALAICAYAEMSAYYLPES